MTSAAVVDGVDIDAVAAAVRTCAAVDDLYSSTAASVASYLPGRQVAGIRVDDRVLTVQVRSVWGTAVADVADQVRTALRPLAPGRSVDVVIGDITDAPKAEPVNEQPVDDPSSEERLVEDQSEQDEVVWTTSTGDTDAISSVPTTPTTVATPPPSSKA